ncbi:MAG: response regulator [Acidimicrobiia bacterium]|nr:response regulator [Acidimicrobiia bacterium]MDH4307506.1 response regulator [Acidimicrobiia bacterium]MDH5293355.1 response regulator [Acidimicrobiia bacterium]
MSDLLLVADDEWVSNDVAAAVTDPGTRLETIDEPEDAAEVVADRRFDAVIVDMQVKNMGGMAIIRLLKDAMSGGKAEVTPIILLLDRQADTFLARRAGADRFLIKPFTSQDLRAALSSLQTAAS